MLLNTDAGRCCSLLVQCYTCTHGRGNNVFRVGPNSCSEIFVSGGTYLWGSKFNVTLPNEVGANMQLPYKVCFEVLNLPEYGTN